MSVFTKTTPVGIDVPIQRFQLTAYTSLLAKWGLPDSATAINRWDSYGRAYRNQDVGNGYTPEGFIGDANLNHEYRELYFDDTAAVISFFGVTEAVKYINRTAVASVYWVFSVDLSKLYTDILWRADEEVRNDVQRFAHVPRNNFVLDGWATGMDAVFREYNGFKTKSGIKYTDQQPLHCFRFNFTLTYPINNCYSPIK